MYVTGEQSLPDTLRFIDIHRRYMLLELNLETLLQFLEVLVYVLPLAPFLVVLESSGDGKTRTLCTSEIPHACKSLLQAHDSPPSYQLLALADLELQVAKLFDVVFSDAAGNGFVEQVEETDDYAREDTRKTVDGSFDCVSARFDAR